VTPESVASVPPPLETPHDPRRTPSQPFRLLDQEEETTPAPVPKPRRRRRRRNWGRIILLLLLVAGVGGGAYWYLKIRRPGTPLPWAGLVDRVKKLVKRASSPPPPAAQRGPARPVAPAPNPYARFDRLSDSLTLLVRNFNDRAALFASGRMDCGSLGQAIVEMERLWIAYNSERRARMATFDLRHVTKDQAQYAAVDSVERRFEQSGCQRP
jgi:hypothetical protein